MAKKIISLSFFIFILLLLNTKTVFAVSCTQYGGDAFGATLECGGLLFTPPANSCSNGSYDYDSVLNKLSCKCNYGYVFNGSFCVSADNLCHIQLGSNSSYDSFSNTCKCDSGYVLSDSSCVYQSQNYSNPSTRTNTQTSQFQQTCPTNSYESNGQCRCDTGYTKLAAGSQCTTLDAACKQINGPNSVFLQYDSTGSPQCGTCPQNYIWNQDTLKCLLPPNTTLCNGKLWNFCPTGQSFFCPTTGDAQCLLPQQQIAPVPSIAQEQKPVIKIEQNKKQQEIISAPSTQAVTVDQTPVTKSERTLKVDTINTPIKTIFAQRSLALRFWSWIKALLNF